jgi:hypothetical protein
LRIATEKFNVWPISGATIAGSVTEDVAHARSGACAKCAASGANTVTYAITPALGTTYFYRFALRLSAFPGATQSLCQLKDNTGTVLEIASTSAGKLEFWNAVTSTHPTGTKNLEAERWYVIEVMLLIPGAGNGTFVAKIDGETVATEQSMNFRNLGVKAVQLGNINSQANIVYLDDFAINDSTGTTSNLWVGVNDPVPPTWSPTRAYWGAIMDGDVYSIGQADAPYLAATQNKFEEHAGRAAGIVSYSDPWLTWDGFGVGATDAVHARGCIPLKSIGGPEGVLTKTLEGQYDVEIAAWAAAASASKHPIFLRPWWEMNTASWPWAGQSNYVEAWRYLHSKVAPTAQNVTWVWCPNVLGGVTDFERYYPGDAYVDWVGLDGYSGENPLKKFGWRAATPLFKPSYERAQEIAPSKPLIICETAASEIGGTKSTWITDLLGTSLQTNMPAVKAVVWFNWNIPQGEGRLDWPIESSEAAQKAAKEGFASSFYVDPPARALADGLKVYPYGEEPKPTPVRKPALELDVEVETPNGDFRRASNSSKAATRPLGLSFGTQRGDGFGTGGYALNRPIFKDYPDLNLLDTHRFVGRNGEIAYEGRHHSNPRTNSPQQQIAVALVGWATYLKSRKIAPLIIDRRLAGWEGPSTQRQGELLTGGARPEGQMSAGWRSEGPKAPGIVFTFARFDGTYKENGEAWFYAGGEDIGALRYDFSPLGGEGVDATWEDRARLSSNDLSTSSDPGTDHDQTAASNQAVSATTSGRKFALVQSQYLGVATGDIRAVHGWLNPRVIGRHGLTARGSEPEEGYYLSEIIEYILATYYPKLKWGGQPNTFPVTQATWHDNPSFGYDILQQLRELALWEMGVWENRTFKFEQNDLTTYDWQIRTDDPGVEVRFEGDSIENFANGVTVSYTDLLSGKSRILYPSEHSELRDESESNPANQQGEALWTDTTVPWSCTEAEAIQFGRAFLAEYNRPKRPGTYRISGGYIQDYAGHWHQGWKPRCGETLGILDHPADEPRLIYATTWDDESKSLDITVDGPEQTLTAIVARHEIAMQSRN